MVFEVATDYGIVRGIIDISGSPLFSSEDVVKAIHEEKTVLSRIPEIGKMEIDGVEYIPRRGIEIIAEKVYTKTMQNFLQQITEKEAEIQKEQCQKRFLEYLEKTIREN